MKRVSPDVKQSYQHVLSCTLDDMMAGDDQIAVTFHTHGHGAKTQRAMRVLYRLPLLRKEGPYIVVQWYNGTHCTQDIAYADPLDGNDMRNFVQDAIRVTDACLSERDARVLFEMLCVYQPQLQL